MNETTLAMCATLEIAAHERALLRATGQSTVRRVAPTQDIAKRLTGFDRGLQTTMPKLSAAGIVVGVKGRHGGHRLARKESDISLLQIYEAVAKPKFDETVDPLATDIPGYVRWLVDLARNSKMEFLDGCTVETVLDEIETREAVDKKPSNPHFGSSLESFLEAEGILEEATKHALAHGDDDAFGF
jgi:DNA-binding IscR family transcriptional regulator